MQESKFELKSVEFFGLDRDEQNWIVRVTSNLGTTRHLISKSIPISKLKHTQLTVISGEAIYNHMEQFSVTD